MDQTEDPVHENVIGIFFTGSHHGEILHKIHENIPNEGDLLSSGSHQQNLQQSFLGGKKTIIFPQVLNIRPNSCIISVNIIHTCILISQLLSIQKGCCDNKMVLTTTADATSIS